MSTLERIALIWIGMFLFITIVGWFYNGGGGSGKFGV